MDPFDKITLLISMLSKIIKLKENILRIPVCPYCLNNANISHWQCINNCSTNYKRLVISITSSDQTKFFFFLGKWIYEVFNTFISKILIQIEKIIIKLLFQENKLPPQEETSSTLEPCIMDGCALYPSILHWKYL